jgi:hypothetical protein
MAHISIVLYVKAICLSKGGDAGLPEKNPSLCG